jgi:hypothetical protein
MHVCEAKGRRQLSKKIRGKYATFRTIRGSRKAGEKTGHSSLPAQETERLFLLPEARPLCHQNWLAVLDDGGIQAVEALVVRRAVIQNQLRPKPGIHLMN